MDVEAHNLRQIEVLNQRGGRTLSVVDLIEAHTITAEMAALCWTALAGGSGLLTGAVPGGAGKTTLMAALLAFLPADEPIVTVSDPGVIHEVRERCSGPSLTLLAHEIGKGNWFGYIWGATVVEFFAAGRDGARPVSCLHTDDPKQTWHALVGLGVEGDDLLRCGLQLHIRRRGRGAAAIHRVMALYWPIDGEPTPVYRWQQDADAHELVSARKAVCASLAASAGTTEAEADEAWRERAGFVGMLAEEGVRQHEEVRARVLSSGLV